MSFGSATSLPHGADGEQILSAGDVILVDTGCRIDGYHSDLTRASMLGGGKAEFERAWDIERKGQQAVFDAAKLGAPCESLDAAARRLFPTWSRSRLSPARSAAPRRPRPWPRHP
ncbi:Xaa-Pro aminopeptidase [Rhizobium sp. BK181]|nr:Xaa-Pro aminopeptidase [Rhizobium sp. BK181]